MQAGTLRHYINVEHLVPGASDGMGNTLETWTALYSNVAAELHPFTSKEIYAGQAVQTYTSHKITIRYLTGIDTTMRVVFGSRKFTINGLVNQDERNIMLTLNCLEVF